MFFIALLEVVIMYGLEIINVVDENSECFLLHCLKLLLCMVLTKKTYKFLIM